MGNEEENDDNLDFEKTIQIIDDLQSGTDLGEPLQLKKKYSLFGTQVPETFGAELTDRTWKSNPFYRHLEFNI